MWKTAQTLIISLACFVFTSANAFAAVTVQIEQNGFGVGPIEVISEDGERWTTIRNTQLTLPVSVYMGITKGYLLEYFILLGNEIIKHKQLLNGPNPHEESLELSGNAEDINGIDQLAILRTCNDKLTIGDGIHQDHMDQESIRLVLRANFYKKKVGLGADTAYPPYEGGGHVNVPIKCVGVPEPQDASVAFKVNDIDLSIGTRQNATTEPTAGMVCKKGRLKVRVATTTTGPAKFKLWKKVGGGEMTAKVINAWASDDGNGGFAAEHVEWISVNKTSQVQAKAEDMVNTIGQSTGWKTKMLYCEGSGGGGLSADTSGGGDDPVPTAKLTGDFSFIDRGSPRCERRGRALINFKPTKPAPHGNVHWSLDCTNGHFSGVARAVSDGNGGYVAPAAVAFKVKKTTHVSCALKSIAPGEAKVHKLRGHRFKCLDGIVGTDVNDLDNPTNPDPVGNSGDDIVVVDPPVTIICENGLKTKSGCVCKKGKKKIKVARNTWECVNDGPIVVVDPIKCKRSEKRIKVRGRWTCVPKGPDVIADPARYFCSGGRILFTRSSPPKPFCKCFKRGLRPVKKGPSSWRCEGANPVVVVDPPKQPPCQNGKIRKGRCHCGRKKMLIKGVCTPKLVNKRLKLKKADKKAIKLKGAKRLKAKQNSVKKAQPVKRKPKTLKVKKLVTPQKTKKKTVRSLPKKPVRRVQTRRAGAAKAKTLKVQ